MVRGTTTSYYHSDGLGSVVALSDSTGAVIERYAYDVYGTPRITDAAGTVLTQSAAGNRFLFTGREYDQESGLYYYRARYYDPKVGRFLQRDPVGYATGINLYTYVSNNPINWVDPFGLFDPEALKNGVLGIAGGFVVAAIGVSALGVTGITVAGALAGTTILVTGIINMSLGLGMIVGSFAPGKLPEEMPRNALDLLALTYGLGTSASDTRLQFYRDLASLANLAQGFSFRGIPTPEIDRLRQTVGFTRVFDSIASSSRRIFDALMSKSKKK